MSVPLQISIADMMRPSFADERALMQSIVDETNESWGAHGVAGVEIVAAGFEAGAAFVQTQPGAQALTVSAVGNWLRASRARKAAA